MGADYSFYVKSIATFALTYFGYIISVLASVNCDPSFFNRLSSISNATIQTTRRKWSFCPYIQGYHLKVPKKFLSLSRIFTAKWFSQPIWQNLLSLFQTSAMSLTFAWLKNLFLIHRLTMLLCNWFGLTKIVVLNEKVVLDEFVLVEFTEWSIKWV